MSSNEAHGELDDPGPPLPDDLRALFGDLLGSIRDAVVVTDARPIGAPGPRIRYVNRAFERNTGYRLEEIEGRSPRFLQGDETERDQLDAVRAAMENFEAVRVQLTNYRADGTMFVIETDIAPLAGEGGEPRYFVAVQRDITERRRRERFDTARLALLRRVSRGDPLDEIAADAVDALWTALRFAEAPARGAAFYRTGERSERVVSAGDPPPDLGRTRHELLASLPKRAHTLESGEVPGEWPTESEEGSAPWIRPVLLGADEAGSSGAGTDAGGAAVAFGAPEGHEPWEETGGARSGDEAEDDRVGALVVFGTRRTPNRAELRLLDDTAALLAILASHRALLDRLAYQAYHDPLTGLANRQLLAESFAAQRARDSGGALLLLDLDDFKTINDTLGHDAGDRVLTRVARRLEASVTAASTVARLGGDEFVVHLAGADTDAARAVAEGIARRVAEPIELPNGSRRITPSVGVALHPDHGDAVDELLLAADSAMYVAKLRGKDGVAIFDPGLTPELRERMDLAHELRSALVAGQFRLRYQTRRDRRGAAVVAEALLRWIHPDRGELAPAAFLRTAAEAGLATAIDRWVIDQVASDVGLVRAAGSPVRLACNLSTEGWTHDELEGWVADALERYGVPADGFEFHLPAAQGGERSVTERVASLAARFPGATFALDGVDRAAAERIGAKLDPFGVVILTAEATRAAASDASEPPPWLRALRAKTAEAGVALVGMGIEDRDRIEAFREFGGDQAQGFALARPVPLRSVDSIRLASEARREAAGGGPDKASER